MKKILLLFACGTFLHLSAQQIMVANFEDDGSDKYTGMEEYRIREEGGTPFEVVNNPKKSDINNSDKVLKLYDVTSAGRLGIGLTGYWDGSAFVPFTDSSDEIVIFDETLSVANYDSFRFKLYLEGETINEELQPYIEFFDWGATPQPERTLGVWSNELEGTTNWNDWNTFTINYTPEKHHGRMILVINNGIWADDPDVTFYIDDIEFFDSYASSSVKENKSGKLDYTLDGKQLTVSEIPTASVLSVFDISGRTLFTTNIESNTAEYTFNANGLYLISLKNGKETITQKILVK